MLTLPPHTRNELSSITDPTPFRTTFWNSFSNRKYSTNVFSTQLVRVIGAIRDLYLHGNNISIKDLKNLADCRLSEMEENKMHPALKQIFFSLLSLPSFESQILEEAFGDKETEVWKKVVNSIYKQRLNTIIKIQSCIRRNKVMDTIVFPREILPSLKHRWMDISLKKNPYAPTSLCREINRLTNSENNNLDKSLRLDGCAHTYFFQVSGITKSAFIDFEICLELEKPGNLIKLTTKRRQIGIKGTYTENFVAPTIEIPLQLVNGKREIIVRATIMSDSISNDEDCMVSYEVHRQILELTRGIDRAKFTPLPRIILPSLTNNKLKMAKEWMNGDLLEAVRRGYLPIDMSKNSKTLNFSLINLIHALTDCTYSLKILHKLGFIHGDIRPGNLLIKLKEITPDDSETILAKFNKSECPHNHDGTTTLEAFEIETYINDFDFSGHMYNELKEKKFDASLSYNPEEALTVDNYTQNVYWDMCARFKGWFTPNTDCVGVGSMTLYLMFNKSADWQSFIILHRKVVQWLKKNKNEIAKNFLMSKVIKEIVMESDLGKFLADMLLLKNSSKTGAQIDVVGFTADLNEYIKNITKKATSKSEQRIIQKLEIILGKVQIYHRVSDLIITILSKDMHFYMYMCENSSIVEDLSNEDFELKRLLMKKMKPHYCTMEEISAELEKINKMMHDLPLESAY